MDANHIVDVPDTPDRVGIPKRDGRDGCSPTISGRNQNATQNRSEGRFLHHRRGIDICEHTGNRRDSVVSVSEHSSASENAPLFRKVGNKPFKPDDRCHLKSHHEDNKKHVHIRCSSKPVNHIEHGVGEYVTGGNIHQLQKASSQCLQKEDKASNSKDYPLNPSEDPLKAKSCLNKGKAKISDDMHKVIPGDIDQRKGLYSSVNCGSEQKASNHLSLPVHSVSSRVAGQKRLVRNGCISPHNIARSKQAAESSSNFTRDLKWASTNKMAKIDPNIVINVDEDLVSGSKSNQIKGKEIVTYPISSREHDTGSRLLSKRVDGALCSSEQDRKSRASHNCDELNLCSISSHGLSSLSLTSGIDPLVNQKHQADTSRRQKRDDPTSSGSNIDLSQRRPCASDAVIEIDDLSPKTGCSSSRSDNDSEARAKQVEADEMLARELQEQLYHEVPVTESAERDSHLAWRLQQEENVQHAPRSGNYNVNLRGSSTSQVRRQSRSQLFQNRYRRGGAQARAPASRLTRLRNSMQRTSRLFPSEMDVDMRIELLEALEAVVDDDISMVTQLLDSDREFTENDYDMLLALDENNHEHLGASSAQISNLPESIVQTNNCESCPICLETPVVGDTIRHLPCLHKFHKDCIDSWLRRKRSCPVCKSDIT